ncbi:MAG TPA: response regulator [Opitutaceae bacterium]
MARILVIDDDHGVRTMLSRTLAHCGHTVIEAENGKIGLDLFPSSNADLVITDLVMPEKEGLEVLAVLRKATPPVKVIAISGGGRHNATEYLNVARYLGASRVLAKPFSIEALMAAVNELVPSAGPVAS